jgi:hypothetical protein
MRINYASLHLDPAWSDLWDSPHSFARREVDRLERQLHDPNTPPADLAGVQHRLAAFAWLRGEVAKRALDPNFRDEDEAKEQGQNAAGRNGWRRALVRTVRAAVSRDTVLPGRIG